MSQRPRKQSRKPARKTRPAFKLNPAEKEVEAIRERRRKLWRELGSLEAVEERGRGAALRLAAAKKAPKRRSA